MQLKNCSIFFLPFPCYNGVISFLLLNCFILTGPPTFYFSSIDAISLLASWTITLNHGCVMSHLGAHKNTDAWPPCRHSNWPQEFGKALWGLGCIARIEDTLLFSQVNAIASLEKGMTVGCFSLFLETSWEQFVGFLYEHLVNVASMNHWKASVPYSCHLP